MTDSEYSSVSYPVLSSTASTFEKDNVTEKDSSALFSFWNDVKSLIGTLRDKQTQRWLVRLVVYPGLAIGATVLVLNLHNIPKVYRRFQNYRVYAGTEVIAGKRSGVGAVMIPQQFGLIYLAAAPLGLLYNVVKATLLWPWVCYQRFNGYSVPFEMCLKAMVPSSNCYEKNYFWIWK